MELVRLVCRSIKAVVAAVNVQLFNTVIAWPENIAAEVNRFFTLANFLHVIGVIDGSLIPIDAPVNNEPVFVYRHGKHSINCMFVCGPSGLFYNVSAKWPGRVHDSRFPRNSTLYRRFEAGNLFPNGVLLGDSGYPLKSWLMTPLHHDRNNIAERRYNSRLKSTRQTIERAWNNERKISMP